MKGKSDARSPRRKSSKQRRASLISAFTFNKLLLLFFRLHNWQSLFFRMPTSRYPNSLWKISVLYSKAKNNPTDRVKAELRQLPKIKKPIKLKKTWSNYFAPDHQQELRNSNVIIMNIRLHHGWLTVILIHGRLLPKNYCLWVKWVHCFTFYYHVAMGGFHVTKVSHSIRWVFFLSTYVG